MREPEHTDEKEHPKGHLLFGFRVDWRVNASSHRSSFEISAARGSSQPPGVLRHKIDHPERVDVDNQTMLAPITVGVNGPGNVRTVITIEREADTLE